MNTTTNRPESQRELHGLSRTPEYRAWCALKSRCLNQRNPDYSHYGGRGVIVCQRWRESFRNFYIDLGVKPFKQYSLDRINVNRNYSCGKCDDCLANGWTMNVRWADSVTQRINQRRNLTSIRLTMNYIHWDRQKKRWNFRIRRNNKNLINKMFTRLDKAIAARDVYLKNIG